MNYSFYTGVTAYIQQSTGCEDGIRVLAEAIPALRPFADMTKPVPAKASLFMKTRQFQELVQFGHLFQPTGEQYPIFTPESYQSASVTYGVIKDLPLARLYLPALSTVRTHVDYVTVECLLPILRDLFGSELVGVKSRAIDESGYFTEAPERILVSAEDRKSAASI